MPYNASLRKTIVAVFQDHIAYVLILEVSLSSDFLR